MLDLLQKLLTTYLQPGEAPVICTVKTADLC